MVTTCKIDPMSMQQKGQRTKNKIEGAAGIRVAEWRAGKCRCCGVLPLGRSTAWNITPACARTQHTCRAAGGGQHSMRWGRAREEACSMHPHPPRFMQPRRAERSRAQPSTGQAARRRRPHPEGPQASAMRVTLAASSWAAPGRRHSRAVPGRPHMGSPPPPSSFLGGVMSLACGAVKPSGTL